MVDVVVLGVNPADKRIALGLKQTLGDPWEEAVKKYPVGSTAEGPVTSLAKFGAFVDLGGGVEGMIHIGDISREKRLNHPNEVLKLGQVVKAQVLEVDRERRRFKLGIKQLEPTSIDEYLAERKAGETVSGRIVDVSGGRAEGGVRGRRESLRQNPGAEAGSGIRFREGRFVGHDGDADAKMEGRRRRLRERRRRLRAPVRSGHSGSRISTPRRRKVEIWN